MGIRHINRHWESAESEMTVSRRSRVAPDSSHLRLSNIVEENVTPFCSTGNDNSRIPHWAHNIIHHSPWDSHIMRPPPPFLDDLDYPLLTTNRIGKSENPSHGDRL